MTKFFLLFLFLGIAGCVRPTPDELYLKELHDRLQLLAEEEKQIQGRIKESKDPGGSIALHEELLLHQSRMERLKATIEVLSPK